MKNQPKRVWERGSGETGRKLGLTDHYKQLTSFAFSFVKFLYTPNSTPIFTL